jgi:hypothetical protein
MRRAPLFRRDGIGDGGAAMLLNGIVFTGATAATLVAAYEWTGLPRHWRMRAWNSGLAVTLWLMWFYGITSP